MEITQIERISKTKVRIFIDGAYAFPLYQKDVIRLQLEEGMELPEKIYKEICEKIILYRAKQKALALLKTQDRTRVELRRKLRVAGYPEEIVDQTIAYVDSYGYLDDERYASLYIRDRKHRKSKLALKTELNRKGISKDILDSVFEAEYQEEESEDPEIIAIKKAVAKKNVDTEQLTWEEKQKLIASLYRKGFDLDKINRILS
ncbi:MAG: regulatory protein RecX [Lachnospiraceae bacterium]|jgi:regulatory protein|nr:regulatory protein RecX [Lachnospiraceae bacterium]